MVTVFGSDYTLHIPIEIQDHKIKIGTVSEDSH